MMDKANSGVCKNCNNHIREKLVEMFDEAVKICGETICDRCSYFASMKCVDERVADYLLANGVTIQQWIPVTERLPTKEDGDDYGFVYTLETDGKRYVRYWGTVVVHTKICTHWMPMPQPPKKEE